MKNNRAILDVVLVLVAFVVLIVSSFLREEDTVYSLIPLFATIAFLVSTFEDVPMTNEALVRYVRGEPPKTDWEKDLFTRADNKAIKYRFVIFFAVITPIVYFRPLAWLFVG